ncbi:MAG: transcription-repair coupling factor, partial [Deltaproteobacteria bacterium]|nr:transcription-repair coupling factor [Deltaproteobacteria bacterium]
YFGYPALASKEQGRALFAHLVGVAAGVMEEFLEKGTADLVHPDDLPRMEELVRDATARSLVAAGYHMVGQVEERGEASLRGGILDVFAPFYAQPLRVELFGDTVESIRFFDPATQRSVAKVREAVILPAREVLADEEAVERAALRMRRRCRETGFGLAQTAELVESLRSSVLSPLRDVFLPYFYDATARLWDHFPADALLVFDEAERTLERAEEVLAEADLSHRRAVAKSSPVPALDDVRVTEAEWLERSDGPGRLDLEELEVARAADGARAFGFATSSNMDLADALKQKRGTDKLLAPFADLVSRARDRGDAVCVAARSAGAAQRLRDLLAAYDLGVHEVESFAAVRAGPARGVSLCLGHIDRGFRFPAERVVVVTQAELLGEKVRRSPTLQRKGFRCTLADVQPGDPIVHADFGIGLYRGLVRLDVQGEEGDFLHLEYADGDRLYLPVTRIALVQKYSAPGETLPRLDKLGGKAWEKARGRAEEGIEQMAHELLELYARRKLATRSPYSAPDLAYQEFEATFPYEETADQLTAIDDVLRDLQGPQPMDRLICGDVGYGKTEVAIRAAFRAVLDGRQVGVLVPTTVLAAQHFETFRKRFEGYPITVEMLSRFVSAAEQRAVCDRASEGKVDIVVGTHRLLQRDVRFKNLGLLVIDEEHRFGVAQKEKLKKLRAHVDILTLSATPIPRSLNMGLSGALDLSVIETPPVDRLAVRTLLARFDDDLIRDAVRRELGRGGQVYFVHNRVQSIGSVVEHVKALVPEARVGVGHGQMHEDELEKVMRAFMTGELDVLVCTAIIESGLDIPRANTILINRADQFGLADLYQLRGRVGRSNLRAYAYLLVQSEAELTADARRRLQALQEFTELGAGFKIATHDLEIRGAGELLGKAQSGQMAAIGYDLYAELLERAVRRLKGDDTAPAPEPDIHLRVAAHFPVDFVGDAKQRLLLYERLTRVGAEAEIDEIRYELIDRYGPLPLPVENLLEVMKVRRQLVDLRAESLDFNGKELVVGLTETTAADLDVVLALVQSDPGAFRITPDHRLRWACGALQGPEIPRAARDLLNQLR